MDPVSPELIESFIADVRHRGAELYRDLPWRNTTDPYEVLVSEVMLQQTQVSRVAGRWERFIAKYPTVDALAAASTGEVLAEWQGLGYNRRALALKRACEECARDCAGELPDTEEGLRALPGVGPATAAGVIVFAQNKPAIYLETNVRAVFIDAFFPDEEKVSDKELVPLLRATCPENDPRTWYYALLDCGWDLKQRGDNPSRRSSQYARQSKYEGSRRQKRAEILRIVLDDPGIRFDAIEARLADFDQARGRPVCPTETVRSIVADMVAEGFFAEVGNGYRAE